MLEPRLRACVRTADFGTAKEIAARIQLLLKPTGHVTRLLQAKNWLYECALAAGETEFAITGYTGTRKLVSPDTRAHLEATVLLAICYIRTKDFDKAKPLIRQAVLSINNVQSPRRRIQLHRRILSRVEEECLLSGIVEALPKQLELDVVHEQAVELVRSKSEDEIYVMIGHAMPGDAVHLLDSVQQFYLGLLPSPERKLLAGPQQANAAKIRELGKKIHGAFKRVAWKSVCDPKTEIHKAWSNGLSIAYDKKYLTASLVVAFQSWKITSVMLVASVIALAMKFGATVFCEAFAPDSIMIHVSERDGNEADEPCD